MIVTASLMRWYAACERHVWLTAHGGELPRDLPTAGARYRLAEGARHEAALLRATTPGLAPVPVRDWDDGVMQTRRLMQAGAGVIVGACLEMALTFDGLDAPVIVRGAVDRLERAAVDGPPLYRPIEIKHARVAQAADWLQLDTYLWLLKQIQGAAPAGELWLGQAVDGAPAARVHRDLDEAAFVEVLGAVVRLLADADAEPDVVIAPHCKRCPWYTACRQDAEARHDVGVLSGLRRETREQFAREGIVTLDQIRAMDADTLLTFRHVGKKTVHAFKAQAEAYLQDRPLWYGPLPDVCREPGWFFDIETDPYNGGRVWSIGWCWHTDDVRIAIVAPRAQPGDVELPDGRRITLVPDADAAWRALAESVSRNEQPIYHWTGFDAGNMRQHASEVYARLGGRLHDLHASFKGAVTLPDRSTSLKVVAPYAGFHWQGYEDWMQAFTDYQRFLRARSGEALAAACAYQADDVTAMVYVWEWLIKTSDEV